MLLLCMSVQSGKYDYPRSWVFGWIRALIARVLALSSDESLGASISYSMSKNTWIEHNRYGECLVYNISLIIGIIPRKRGATHQQSKLTGKRIFIMIRQDSAIPAILMRFTSLQDVGWLVLSSTFNFIRYNEDSVWITLENTSLIL